MDRVLQRNVLAMSGRAVEAAGDVDTLLLDKTGTITLGNRQASEIVLADGVLEAVTAGPAEPGLDVYARAHCYKLTRSIAFVRATAYDRDLEDPVATAQAAFMLTGSAPAGNEP